VINYSRILEDGENIFIGVDMHRKRWHVTVMTEELELFNASIPGCWNSLRRVMDRYKRCRIKVVYEAGYFGFWLYDKVREYGAECIVTPPSLLPQEYGNRVKTDRRDSRKLAYFLSKGMLKRVSVPSREQLYHRQVLRRRRQLITDRVRVQNRIKAELRFYGVELPEPRGKWSNRYLNELRLFQFENRWIDQSFQVLVEQYEFLSQQIEKQTGLLQELSESEAYCEKVTLLRSVPGIGLIAAMELLLELGDITRFQRADKLAAYVGLTPSQYSSADKIRMGRITKAGKSNLRGILIEASWTLITKDQLLRGKYEKLKARSGAKRAIVAIARTLLVRIRRLLLDEQPYVMGLVA
jgi:transposase